MVGDLVEPVISFIHHILIDRKLKIKYRQN